MQQDHYFPFGFLLNCSQKLSQSEGEGGCGAYLVSFSALEVSRLNTACFPMVENICLIYFGAHVLGIHIFTTVISPSYTDSLIIM